MLSGERGDSARSPLRAPAPRRGLGGGAARAGGEGLHRRRGAAPPHHHLPRVRSAGNGPDLQCGEAEWVLPWSRPPAWLYLPHQAATAGHEPVDAMLRQGGSGGGAAGSGAEADAGGAAQAAEDRGNTSGHTDVSRGGYGVEDARGDQRPQAHAIRGQARLPGPRRGDDAATRTGGEQAAAIRGQAILPGPTAGPRGGRAREQAALEARLAPLARSLQDHAERVAAKRARSGEAAAGPTAATRLEALRKRVADKCEGRSAAGDAQGTIATIDSSSSSSASGGATAAAGSRDVERGHGMDDAAAHDAARRAHHGVEGEPAVDQRQLRGRR